MGNSGILVALRYEFSVLSHAHLGTPVCLHTPRSAELPRAHGIVQPRRHGNRIIGIQGAARHPLGCEVPLSAQGLRLVARGVVGYDARLQRVS